MTIWNSIVFVINNDPNKSHYFYNSSHNSDYGHLYAVEKLTLQKALIILKSKGIDALKDVKITIQCYTIA